MFVKISFEDEFKKVIFKEEYKCYEKLLALVKKVTKKEEKDFQLFFTDLEKTEIEIKDDLDIEYFLSQVDPDKVIREIRVVKREQIEKEAEPLKQDQIDSPYKEKPDIDVEPLEEPFELTEKEKPVTQEQPKETPVYVGEISESTFDIKEEKKEPIVMDDKDEELLNEASKNQLNTMEESFHLAIDKISQVRDKVAKRENKLKELPDKLEKQMEIKKKNEDRRKEKEIRKKKKMVRDQILHENVSCDMCKVHPIKGRRFNCMVCPDYDLCERCEASQAHSHPMMRILKPASFAEMLDYKKTFANMDRPKPKPTTKLPTFFNKPSPKPRPMPTHMSIKPRQPPKPVYINQPFDDTEKRQILDRILGNQVDEQTKINMINGFRHCNNEEFELKINAFFSSVLPGRK